MSECRKCHKLYEELLIKDSEISFLKSRLAKYESLPKTSPYHKLNNRSHSFSDLSSLNLASNINSFSKYPNYHAFDQKRAEEALYASLHCSHRLENEPFSPSFL